LKDSASHLAMEDTGLKRVVQAVTQCLDMVVYIEVNRADQCQMKTSTDMSSELEGNEHAETNGNMILGCG
jgi:hypothetical protein